METVVYCLCSSRYFQKNKTHEGDETLKRRRFGPQGVTLDDGIAHNSQSGKYE